MATFRILSFVFVGSATLGLPNWKDIPSIDVRQNRQVQTSIVAQSMLSCGVDKRPRINRAIEVPTAVLKTTVLSDTTEGAHCWRNQWFRFRAW
jgi:hypothetical protein